jgi:mono/diheme cytochrome c family protein
VAAAGRVLKSKRQWLALATLLALVASGCGEAGQRADGKEVFTEHCSSCHQVDGRGYDQVYPNLAGNPIVQLPDAAPMIDIVLNGRGSMPPFAEELTQRQLAAVISYVRGAWGNDQSAVSPPEVG